MDEYDFRLMGRLHMVMERFDLPEAAQETIEAWVMEGRPTGGFLDAVLRDSFSEAVGRADDQNRQRLYGYACVLSVLPAACWGSAERVARWHRIGGLKGT
jgi:hypothetical protein